MEFDCKNIHNQHALFCLFGIDKRIPFSVRPTCCSLERCGIEYIQRWQSAARCSFADEQLELST